jgi:hypothetical protein
MSTFLGSSTSGILIDDTQLILISGENNAIKLLSNSTDIDLGTYSLTNLGIFKESLNLNNNRITNLGAPIDDNDAATKVFVAT